MSQRNVATDIIYWDGLICQVEKIMNFKVV